MTVFRHMLSVRHAFTASLLGMAVLVHAGVVLKPAEEDPWTQVDLNSVPDPLVVSVPLAKPGTAPQLGQPLSVAKPAPETKPTVAPTPSVKTEPAASPTEPVAKKTPTFALSTKDRTIRAGVERWATAAGWKLSWEIKDSPQTSAVRFDADFGTDFDVALSKLCGVLKTSENKGVQAYLYDDNRVLRIVEEGVRS